MKNIVSLYFLNDLWVRKQILNSSKFKDETDSRNVTLLQELESLKQESEVGNFSLLFPMLFLHFTNHKTASSSSPHVSSAHRF